jgi:hypothetical protein
MPRAACDPQEPCSLSRVSCFFLTISSDGSAGALFCFKRGHMRKLVTVPNTGIGFEGHVLDRGETSGEENGDAEMVLR